MLLEYSLVQYLVDPIVREQVRPHLTTEMFQVSEAQTFLRAIMSPALQNMVPDVATFTVEAYKIKDVSNADVREAVKILNSGSACTSPAGIEQRLLSIEGFIRDQLVSRSIQTLLGSEDASFRGMEKYQHVQTAIGFQIVGDSFTDFTDLDTVLKARMEDLPPDGRIIKSKHSLINRNTTYNGYKYGDIIMVSAETGVGKTTFMVGEAAHAVLNGHKVCHVGLGDMTEFDLACMYITNWSKHLEAQVVAEVEKYHPLVKDHFANLRVKTFPADKLTVYELEAKLEGIRRDFPFDFLVIDYDANIKATRDNMYEEGGSTYGQLKGYSAKRCATMIGSQVKPQYWGQELLPKEAPNESSKKQMHVDIMINLGRNQVNPSLGTLSLAKVRRGVDNKQARLRLAYAYKNIHEITQEDYDSTLAAQAAANAARVEGSAESTPIDLAGAISELAKEDT